MEVEAEAETASVQAEGEAARKSHEEGKPARMNRRQWKAARGNREDKATRKHRLRREANENKLTEYLGRMAVEVEVDEDRVEVDEDPETVIAMRYRDLWMWSNSRFCGSYEDTTSLRPMRYTDEPVPRAIARCSGAVLIFSVKVTELQEGLAWPLDVFGFVAARDSLDYNRNLLFNRSRDNCQTLTAEDVSLVLTGPTRAVVIIDPVHFEVELKVKGETQSQDKVLSFLVICDNCIVPGTRPHPYNVFCHEYSSKFSTVQVTVGHLACTVEATVAVQVVEGSWLTEYQGRFVARVASCNDQNMVLLDFRDGAVSIIGDGKIKLSRCVVSVELYGELMLSVDAWQCDDKVDVAANDQVTFTPKEAGRSKGVFDVGFCKMAVTVAWSLLSRPK